MHARLLLRESCSEVEIYTISTEEVGMLREMRMDWIRSDSGSTELSGPVIRKLKKHNISVARYLCSYLKNKIWEVVHIFLSLFT